MPPPLVDVTGLMDDARAFDWLLDGFSLLSLDVLDAVFDIWDTGAFDAATGSALIGAVSSDVLQTATFEICSS